jgi:chaperonin GroES
MQKGCYKAPHLNFDTVWYGTCIKCIENEEACPRKNLNHKSKLTGVIKMAKIQPLGDRVLVQAEPAEEKTSSGIIIPDTAKEKPQQGTIKAVGAGKVENGNKIEMTVKEGDKVLYGKYAGTEVTLDGEEYLIMRESDIMGIVS